MIEQAHHWRDLQLKIGFTNGCFDILHAGHVWSLEFARQLCDRLIVAVNDDDGVAILKGPDRPIIAAEDRAIIINALRCVDEVTIFALEELEPLIAHIEPDVLVKGDDYRGVPIVGSQYAKSLMFAPMTPLSTSHHSTTQIIRTVRARG